MTPYERSLTPREQDIMRLVAEGLPNKVVAYRCGLCESTVKQHLHQVMLKLQLRNRTEVAIHELKLQLARRRSADVVLEECLLLS
jgi:DNA-binding NarL/FixJ family response regulator